MKVGDEAGTQDVTAPEAKVEPATQAESTPAEPPKVAADKVAALQEEIAALKKAEAAREKAKLTEQERVKAEMEEAKAETARLRREAAFLKAGLDAELHAAIEEYRDLGTGDDPAKAIAKLQKILAKRGTQPTAAPSGGVGARVNPSASGDGKDIGGPQTRDKEYWDSQYFKPKSAA